MKTATYKPKPITKKLAVDHVPTGIHLSRHFVGTVTVKEPSKLFDSNGFLARVHKVLESEDVNLVGEATHVFSNESFTSVIALSESHISIHTWPERHVVQLDVFLCNYLHDNTAKCERIFDTIVEYFEPVSVQKIAIERL
jgi:S-adenosylmethionine decarboxylase